MTAPYLPPCAAVCASSGLGGVPAPPELSTRIRAAFEGSAEDERESRIKAGVAGGPCRKHFCPQGGQFARGSAGL